MTYCSSSGRTDWQKAWLTSPVLAILRICVAIAMRRRSSRGDMTGAKQLLFDQSWGSRFPRTTMQYFSRSDLPFSSVLRRRNNDLRRINSVDRAAFECYIFTYDA